MASIALFVTFFVGLVPLLAPVAPAFACSAGDDFDPIAGSELVVGGWVIAWQDRPDLSTMGELHAVAIDLQVDRVFKGTLPAGFEVIDNGSYMPGADGWFGGLGACGSFDADPTGSYVIAGLSRAEDGTYQMNRLRTFFVGKAPSGSNYETALARLSRIAPPVTGNGGLFGSH
jgi:hypothetical protein